MKVPILERQVAESPIQINTPQIPRAVPGAFGEQIGEAVEGLGKTIGSNIAILSQHIARRNEELSQEKAYDTFTKASRDTQNLLTSSDIKTVQSQDGKEYDVPSGILNRNGNQANGSVIDYDRQIETLYKGYTDGMDNISKREFDRLFIPHSESLRNRAISHEVQQRDIAVKQGFLEFKDQALASMDLLDEEHRIGSINEVDKRINELQQSGRFTYEEAQKQREDFSSSLVDQDLAKDNAIVPENSYTLNELIKGNKGVYPNLSDKDRAAAVERMQIKINRNKKLMEFSIQQNQDENEKKMYIDWIDQKLTPKQVRDTILSTGVRLKFGKTLMTNFYKDTINPKTDFNVYNEVKQMQLDEKPLEDINQFILDNSNNISDKDKKELINFNYSAQAKKDTMLIKSSTVALKDWASRTMDSLVSDKDQPSNEIVYDFLQRVNTQGAKGEKVDEILKEVQRDYIKKYNPSVTLLADVPNIIASRNRIQKVYGTNSNLTGVKSEQKNRTVVSSDIDFDSL